METTSTADSHADRRGLILELIQGRRISSQQELAELLKERGFEASQSSVWRDLRGLGVGKVGGRYVAPPSDGKPPASHDLEEAARFLRSARPAGPHLTVVLSAVGTAQTVALAIDRGRWPEVVGTIAGDDTIFIATAGARDQSRLLSRLAALQDASPGGTTP